MSHSTSPKENSLSSTSFASSCPCVETPVMTVSNTALSFRAGPPVPSGTAGCCIGRPGRIFRLPARDNAGPDSPQLPGQLYGIIGLAGDLPERYRIAGGLRELCLIDVDPDAHDREGPTITAETVFNEDPACLSVTPIDVVGPLDPCGCSPSISAEQIMAGQRNAGAECKGL